MTNSYAHQVDYAGRPAYDLQLQVSRHSTSGNSSKWDWSLWALNPGNLTATWFSDPKPWSVWIEGQNFTGSGALDFRGGQSSIFLGSGTTNFFAHDSAGWLTIDVSATHTTAPELFGNASLVGSFVADRIPKAPGAPPIATFVSATSSALNFTISQPADNGGSAVLDYFLQLATDSGFSNVVQSRTSGSSAQTFTGLDANVTHYLRYRARNAIGSGPFSPTRSGKTLVGVPSAVRDPEVSNLAPTSCTVSWLAPTSNGGGTITTYRIQRATNSGFTAGLVEYTQGATLSRDFTDLAPSATYYFRIRAENSAGAGAWSPTLTVTTVSGAYYSNGSTWIPVGLFVSDTVDWEAAEIEVSDGTNWITAI